MKHATARLIAAAPEMADALVELERTTANLIASFERSRTWEEIDADLEELRKARAKHLGAE